MNTRIIIIIFILICLACNNDREQHTDDKNIKAKSELVFDKSLWNLKEGKDYPFRDKMLNDIIYNDTIRSLNKDEILDLLGEPSYYRDNKNFLYYRIKEKRLASWTLHTKTMVIKLSDDKSIAWIKIHE